MSDTFAEIRLLDVPAFIVAQLLEAFAATLLFNRLVPISSKDAKAVVVPREEADGKQETL